MGGRKRDFPQRDAHHHNVVVRQHHANVVKDGLNKGKNASEAGYSVGGLPF
jgi:hypothetical protein